VVYAEMEENGGIRYVGIMRGRGKERVGPEGEEGEKCNRDEEERGKNGEGSGRKEEGRGSRGRGRRGRQRRRRRREQ